MDGATQALQGSTCGRPPKQNPLPQGISFLQACLRHPVDCQVGQGEKGLFVVGVREIA